MHKSVDIVGILQFALADFFRHTFFLTKSDLFALCESKISFYL